MELNEAIINLASDLASDRNALDLTEIKERFGPYRIPTETTRPKFKAIQEKALEFAILIHELCPHSKQKANALTLLENCKMQANAAIAIHEGNPPAAT